MTWWKEGVTKGRKSGISLKQNETIIIPGRNTSKWIIWGHWWHWIRLRRVTWPHTWYTNYCWYLTMIILIVFSLCYSFLFSLSISLPTSLSMDSIPVINSYIQLSQGQFYGEQRTFSPPCTMVTMTLKPVHSYQDCELVSRSYMLRDFNHTP